MFYPVMSLCGDWTIKILTHEIFVNRSLDMYVEVYFDYCNYNICHTAGVNFDKPRATCCF